MFFQVYDGKASPANKNRVYVWGFQETGALGTQTNTKKAQERYTQVVNHPTRLQFSENCDIDGVCAGYGFSLFSVNRSDEQTLFGTGINSDSQLSYQGEKDVIIYPTAVQLPRKPEETHEDLKVKCMGAGRAHAVVVTKNGTTFTLGNNSYGQCGRNIIKDEIYKSSHIVHRIENGIFTDEGDEIVGVECGQDHTMFLTQRGKVYTCGWGADGQTGRGHYLNSSDIMEIKGDIEGEKIIKLACSSDCVLALNDKGEVFGWGNSEYGQLDDSEHAAPQVNTPKALEITKGKGQIKDIASGGSFCMILNEEGLIYTWGYGILGFGPYVQQTSKPEQLLPPLFGSNDFADKVTVVSIGCGVFHMGAINSNGDLFMWGKNRFSCLGLGHKKDQFFPFKTAVNAKVLKVGFGVDHTIALCKGFV